MLSPVTTEIHKRFPAHFTGRRGPIPKTVLAWGIRGDKLGHADSEAEAKEAAGTVSALLTMVIENGPSTPGGWGLSQNSTPSWRPSQGRDRNKASDNTASLGGRCEPKQSCRIEILIDQLAGTQSHMVFPTSLHIPLAWNNVPRYPHLAHSLIFIHF